MYPKGGKGVKGVGVKGGFAPKGGKGGGAAFQQAAFQQPAARRLTPDQLKERIHGLIYSTVEEAAAPVQYLETSWGEGELQKRITKYIFKAACDADLYTLPWPKLVEELVARAMHGYSAACQDQDWFFSIDLNPVFFAIASEIILNNGIRIPEELLYEAVVIEYEDKLDKILLDRAMWEAAKGTMGELLDEKSVSKVFHALSKTYWPALDEVLQQSLMADFQGWLSPEQELQRVEHFFKKWANESMNRAWGAIPDAETILTQDVAETLFRTLLAPFGDEDPFSCVPQIFTETIGRPPTDWAFIGQALREVFSQWGPGGGASKKKRKAESQVEWAGAAAPAKKIVAAKAKVAATGHPSCTSEADCIGTPETTIIQHMLNGEAGDLYCQLCWDSFVKRNPELEGVPLE